MRKFLSVFLLSTCMLMPSLSRANDLSQDTSDPLFLLGDDGILSQSAITYWDHILRAGQSVSYGMNNRLTIGADVHYQHDFNGTDQGRER